jgi:hypothetical protein
MEQTKMRKLITTAVVILSISNAHAGQWLDTNNHIALGGLPDNSEPIARLLYAKAACRARTGVPMGGQITPAYTACMRAQGFVFSGENSEVVIARQRAAAEAAQDAQLRALGSAVGKAFTDYGNEISQPPLHCPKGFLVAGC